ILPSAFYRITTPDWQLALLDQTVDNSPLTLNQQIIRGLHLRIGAFTLHAGYSPLATFENFLIPTQHEMAAGVGYSEKISKNYRLMENFYYFPSPPKGTGTVRPGGVGSVLYQLEQPRGLNLSAELGFSRGVAGAGEIEFRGSNDYLNATFQQKPQDFASLSI